MEEDRSVYEVLGLKFGACKMVVAGKPCKRELLESDRHMRVATKYPRTAREYFESQARDVEIIKLNGSVELGPIVSLADVIVDIVESGATLKANGLIVLEEIMPLSARVIVNPASLQVKHEALHILLEQLQSYLRGENDDTFIR